MQTILKSSAAKIRTTFTGPDGEAADVTVPTVTITRDSDGVAVATAAAATDESEAGVISYSLIVANTPTVDLLRATWAGIGGSSPPTEVGVVGGFLCSLEAIKAVLGGSPTALTLRTLREEVEEKLETVCNVAFRPSYHRETLDGDGTTELLLTRRRPTSILTASLDGENVLADLSIKPGGIVTRDQAFPSGSELRIAYVHGWPAVPSAVTRAAVRLAVAFNEGGDDRVNRFREDDQEFWLSVAGDNHVTGIPEVDRVIRDYGYSPYF